MQKRVLAIHDISCVGRCSLTVALPVLSCLGHETSVLPTAVLSTHTGEFSGYTYRDLTDDLPGILHHWESLGLTFDAIYPGFLGSFAQIQMVDDLLTRFAAPGAVLLLDPVMADHGRLYKTYTPQMAEGIRRLAARADILTPNITEACLLLGLPYAGENISKNQAEDMLFALHQLGPRYPALTGVSCDKDTVGAAVLDGAAGQITYAQSPRYDGIFYGTGDLFASALLGVLLRGASIGQAAQLAVQFVDESIRASISSGRERRYGVQFENALPGLIEHAAALPLGRA